MNCVVSCLTCNGNTNLDCIICDNNNGYYLGKVSQLCEYGCPEEEYYDF
jgi:hypothetical protein